MKILLASHVFAPSTGGIETMSGMLTEEFIRQGHDVKVVTQTTNPDNDNFTYDVFRQPGKWQLLRLVQWSDVFFHNNISLQTAWPALITTKPWIVAHHTWIGRDDGTHGWQDKAKHFFCRFATGISISQSVADHAPKPSTVIGNCYRDDLFRVLPGVARDTEIVFLGRLVSDKGVDVLLNALGRLKSQGLVPNLTIIGNGPELNQLQQLAENLQLKDTVRFVGAKTGEELVHLLNAHQIMVVPSRWQEPFGLVALEGIACGCVTVGSEGGGLKDAIGPCGLTFPNGDADALANVLTELLTRSETRDAYRASAAAHLARHTPAFVARAYLDVFEAARR